MAATKWRATYRVIHQGHTSLLILTSPVARMQSIVMSLSVCLSVCQSAGITQKNTAELRQLFCAVPVACGSS